MEASVRVKLRVIHTAALFSGDGRELPVRGLPLALLVALAVEESPWEASELARLLWGARADPRASLRQAIYSIRRLGGFDIIEREGQRITLSSTVQADVTDIRSAIASTRPALLLSIDSCELADPIAGRGLTGWTRWLSGRQDSLTAAYTRSLQTAADNAVSDTDVAIMCLRRAVDTSPQSVALHARLVRTLLRARREADAFEAVLKARSVFASDADAQASIERLAKGLSLPSRPHHQPESRHGPGSIARPGTYDRLSAWTSSSTGIAIIEGATGSGRSTLLRDVAEYHERHIGPVVQLVAPESQSTLHLALVTDLIRALRQQPGSLGGSTVSDRVLNELLPETGASAAGVATDLRIVADALADLVAAVADEGHVMIAIDDLHQADVASLTVLARIGRAARGQLVLVGTIWSGVARSVELEEVRQLATLRIPLRPIARPQLVDRLSQLGLSETETMAVADRICEWSGGDPEVSGALIALAEELKREHDASDSFEGWPLDPPPVVHRLWRQRTQDLPEHALPVARRLVQNGALTEAELDAADLDAARTLTGSGLILLDDRGQLAPACAPARRALLSRLKRTWSRSTAVGGIGLAAAALAGVLVSSPGLGPTTGSPSGDFYVIEGSRLTPLGIAGTEDGSVLTLPDSFRLGHAERMHDGGVWYFGRTRRGGEIAPSAAIVDDRGEYVFLRNDSIQSSVLGVSPRGDWAVVSEQTSTPEEEWRERLILQNVRDPSRIRELMPPRPLVNGGPWSPDGLTIVSVAPSMVDTIRFLWADGRPRSESFDTTYHRLWDAPTWCPDSRHVVAVSKGVDSSQEALVRIDAETGQRSTLPVTLRFLRKPICLAADADVIAIRGIRPPSIEESLVMIDFRGPDPVERTLASTHSSQFLLWVPDEPVRPFEALEARVDRRTLAWGDRVALHAHATRSDGSTQPVSPEWETLTPGVLTIEESELIAAGTGAAQIMARLGDLRDTIHLVVTGNPRDEVIVEEEFDPGWETRWDIETALPRPTSTFDSASGSWLLNLNGNGMFDDTFGLVERLDLSLGLTVEFEFNLLLSLRTHQRFMACLRSSSSDVREAIDQLDAQTCFTYPYADLDRRRTDIGLLSTHPPGEVMTIPIPNDSAWHHVAIQVSPAGRPTLFFDREAVATSEWLLPTPDGTHWYLVLGGHSREGRTQIRNVLVRRGEQYPASRSPTARR